MTWSLLLVTYAQRVQKAMSPKALLLHPRLAPGRFTDARVMQIVMSRQFGNAAAHCDERTSRASRLTVKLC